MGKPLNSCGKHIHPFDQKLMVSAVQSPQNRR